MAKAKTGGRRKGTLNKTTLQAKEFCASIIDDPRYQENLRQRAIAATLSPAIETMLWAYARGVPRQTIAIEGKPFPMYVLAAGVPGMSPDEPDEE